MNPVRRGLCERTSDWEWSMTAVARRGDGDCGMDAAGESGVGLKKALAARLGLEEIWLAPEDIEIPLEIIKP